MAGGLKPQGAGGFDLSRLFAKRSGARSSDVPSTKQHERSASNACKVARALPQLVWDPLTLNDGASALQTPVPRSRAGGPHGEAKEHQPRTGLQHAAIRLEDFEVEFPMALRLCLGLTAQPDVQLQLVSVRTGSEARQQPASGHSTPPKADGALVLVKNAATLGFLGLLFPDAAGPWLRNMAVAGAVSSVFMAGRRSAQKRGWSLRRPSLRINLRENGSLVKGAKAASQATHEFCTAAAMLGLGALTMWVADERLYHLGRCLIASVTLSSGYAQTARRAAKGLVRQGPEREAAWRARHKWAAQRVAPLLGDLHDQPPLGGVALVQSLLSFATARTGGPQSLAGVPESLWPSSLIAGLGRGEDGINVWGSVAIPRRRTLEELDFSKPSKPDQTAGAPCKPLPSGPLQQAAARQRATAAAAAAAQRPAAGTSSSSSAETAGRRGSKQRLGHNPAATQLPPAGPPQGDGHGMSGLKTPDREPMYATSRLLTVRSREELEVVSRKMRDLAASQGISTAAAGDVLGSEPAMPEATVADSALPTATGSAQVGALEGAHAAAAASPGMPAPSNLTADPGVAYAASEIHKALAPAFEDPEPLAALYGRADHLRRQEARLTGDECVALFFRALYLLLVFAPFLLLGVPLLLIAACIPGGQQESGSEAAQLQAAKAVAEVDPEAPVAISAPDGGVDVGPASSLVAQAEAPPPSPVVEEVLETGHVGPPQGAALRRLAFNLLLFGCRQSGAAFIKWGQWASSRPDLLPEDLCEILTALQQDAPQHTYEETRLQIESSFGHPIEAIFDSFREQPLASASIAQVHKAVIRVDGKATTVAVKVRHPGVERRIIQDFQLLIPLARATSKFKALKGLSLEQSVSQFSNTMTAQADLRVEAAHLRRFLYNFRALSDSITAPRPVDPWVSAAVLVETFQPGVSVEQFIRRPAPFNTQVVGLGVDAYLKMLLVDNYVHTDLHPGNIFICRQQTQAGQAADAAALEAAAAGSGEQVRLQMTLLDFGLAEELTPVVRHHFISFLHAISAGNGERAAELLLLMGNNAACPDRDGFTHDMVQLFRRASRIDTRDGINVDAVLKAVLRLARKHEVAIDSSYAALVLGVCVIVGFATGLDPQVNLMDAATPCLFFNNLYGRVAGRLYPD